MPANPLATPDLTFAQVEQVPLPANGATPHGWWGQTVLEPLRQRPGLIVSITGWATGARCRRTAHAINKGRYAGSRPAGHYRAWSSGGDTLYVTYLGEAGLAPFVPFAGQVKVAPVVAVPLASVPEPRPTAPVSPPAPTLDGTAELVAIRRRLTDLLADVDAVLARTRGAAA